MRWAAILNSRKIGTDQRSMGLSKCRWEHINSGKEYSRWRAAAARPARMSFRENFMIIEGPDQVTPAVLAEIARAETPRFREIMTALVKHLHAFVREAKLTEEEFHQACAYVNAIGQASNAFHNEAVLASGSLGVSTLVCLLNNGA